MFTFHVSITAASHENYLKPHQNTVFNCFPYVFAEPNNFSFLHNKDDVINPEFFFFLF